MIFHYKFCQIIIFFNITFNIICLYYKNIPTVFVTITNELQVINKIVINYMIHVIKCPVIYISAISKKKVSCHCCMKQSTIN